MGGVPVRFVAVGSESLDIYSIISYLWQSADVSQYLAYFPAVVGTRPLATVPLPSSHRRPTPDTIKKGEGRMNWTIQVSKCLPSHWFKLARLAWERQPTSTGNPFKVVPAKNVWERELKVELGTPAHIVLPTMGLFSHNAVTFLVRASGDHIYVCVCLE